MTREIVEIRSARELHEFLAWLEIESGRELPDEEFHAAVEREETHVAAAVGGLRLARELRELRARMDLLEEAIRAVESQRDLVVTLTNAVKDAAGRVG